MFEKFSSCRLPRQGQETQNELAREEGTKEVVEKRLYAIDYGEEEYE